MPAATIDEAALMDLHEQAQALVQNRDFRDAIALYDMAIRGGDRDISARARGALVGVLAEMSNAVAGSPGALRTIEQCYVRIKQLISENLAENPSFYWSMQTTAVMVAENMLYRYTGPRGVMGIIASGGAGAHQLAKQSEDSYKRLTNELLLLVKYGQNALAADGAILDFCYVGGAYAALEAMDAFARHGQPAPVYVLDFFANVTEDQIYATSADDPNSMRKELANVGRLIHARRQRG